MKFRSRYVLQALALLSWLALATWLTLLARGGGRDTMHYAERLIQTPLLDGETLLASDWQRSLWSGWLFDPAQHDQTSVGITPDIVFRRIQSGGPCTLRLDALAHTSTPQHVFVSLNRGPSALTEIGASGQVDIALPGRAIKGLDTLSFRLPDAVLINERMVSITVRALAVSCLATQAPP